MKECIAPSLMLIEGSESEVCLLGLALGSSGSDDAIFDTNPDNFSPIV